MAFFNHLATRVIQKVYFGPNVDASKAVPKERDKNAPKPLPIVRPRALTHPIVSEGNDISKSSTQISNVDKEICSKNEQSCCRQTRSHLLNTLPFEVRLQIWRYCVASFDVHIVRGKNRLFSIPCLGEEEQTRLPPCQHKCWGSSTKALWGYYGVCPGYYIGPNGCPHLSNVIPLLQSCRMM